MSVKPIPDGYHTATPYMIVKDAAAAIDFYVKAFGATEIMRLHGPDGRVGHAEIRIGNSPIMLGGECPEWGAMAPNGSQKLPVSLYLYVENVDAFTTRAVGAGAKVVHPVDDKFYGDRTGTLTDPFGHTWTVATHVEDVTTEQVAERMKSFMKKSA